MLALTPAAGDAVRMLVAGMDVDEDTAGLRVSLGGPTGEGRTLDLAVVSGPEPTDDEIESQGAYVFVEAAAAELVADAVLDAEIERGRVRFVVGGGAPATVGGNGQHPR